MMFVQLNEAVKMFELGSLKKCSIRFFDMKNGYVMSFEGKRGTDVIVLDSQRDSGGVGRVFKTLDAAFLCARKIGFRDVHVFADL